MLSLKNVCKTITNSQKQSVKVLSNINLEIRQGDFVCIQGPNGSGKTALLSVLCTADLKFNGEYYIDGIELSKYTAKQLATIRQSKFGVITQNFELLQKASVGENISLPLKYAKVSRANRAEMVKRALNYVGLSEAVASLKPADLSCGQQQRVALARALVLNPQVLIADVPTSFQDEEGCVALLNLFTRLNREGVTIIMVSNDERFLQKAKRVFTINKGMLVENIKVTRGKNIGEVIDINAKTPLKAKTAVKKTVVGVAKQSRTSLQDVITQEVEEEAKEIEVKEKPEEKKKAKKVKDNSSEQISMAEISTEEKAVVAKDARAEKVKTEKPKAKKAKSLADLIEKTVKQEAKNDESEMLVKPVKSRKKSK